MQNEARVADNGSFIDDTTYCKTLLGPGTTTSSEETKIVGVKWCFTKDVLLFEMEQVATAASRCKPTKRSVVSVAARFFDPLGFMSPTVIKLKAFVQQLCTLKLAWD